MALALQISPEFFVGINDPLGGNPKGTPFTPVIFNLFDAWVDQHLHNGQFESEHDEHLRARGYYIYLDHPEAGHNAYDGPQFRLSETPAWRRNRNYCG